MPQLKFRPFSPEQVQYQATTCYSAVPMSEGGINTNLNKELYTIGLPSQLRDSKDSKMSREFNEEISLTQLLFFPVVSKILLS